MNLELLTRLCETPGAPAAQIDAAKRDHAAIMEWLCAELRAATA